MLGRQHFTLSVTTAFLVLTPFFGDHRIAAISALAGIAIGSLIPDIDAPDATVFHSKIKGLHRSPAKLFGAFISPLLPLFGYLTKYLVYVPSVFLLNVFSGSYRFEEGHRSFTHSLVGVAVLTAATGLLLRPVFAYLGVLEFLFFFLAGYSAGALLHMLQDSFTRSGIAWNQPFSSLKLEGELRTGKDNFRPHFYLLVLAVASLLNLVSFTGSFLQAGVWNGLLLAVVCWTFFAWMSGVELSR